MATNNTANNGFEKQIWDAACVLRGNMDASEYKNVVLGLIFLKYISDRFDEKYQALVAEGDGFEEDVDEYTSEGIFFVPANARWSVIASKAHTPEIGTVIDEAMRATAIKNKGIAFFLSRKAQKEGMSEYEIINDWVKLLSITAPEDSDTIKRLIGLSRVINILDEDDLPDDSLQRLNTLEAFDYSINDYYLPVAAGDVFTNDQGEWFVLIGQDCDMARRPNTPPRNALAELLSANIRRQTSCKKWANDLETASIYSFRKSQEAESEILQVNYQQRKFIANEIINLCAFNTDGQCRIPLIAPPSKEQVQLMPGYMITYYTELQKYFSSVKVLKEQVNDAFETVISNEYAPRLLSVGDYTIDADVAFFNLRRVCRLTHSYVYYLYKLFLEYRGRQPFQTINLIRQEEVTLPVVFNRTESGVFMSIRCVPVPDKPNRRDYCWIISLDELNRVLGKLEDNVTVCEGVKEDLIIDSESIEWPLSNQKKLTLKKAKEKVELSVT